jgi:hypothetical protein
MLFLDLRFHFADLCAYTECWKFIWYIPSNRYIFMTTAIDTGAEAFPVSGQTAFFTARN